MKWNLIFFSIWTIGFIYLAVRVIGYFLYKSVQALHDLNVARDNLAKDKKELEKYRLDK